MRQRKPRKPRPHIRRDDPGVEIAVEAAGGFAQLGRALGISASAVMQWTRVPVDHVLTIESLFNIPRWEIRPDIYPPPQRHSLRSSNIGPIVAADRDC